VEQGQKYGGKKRKNEVDGGESYITEDREKTHLLLQRGVCGGAESTSNGFFNVFHVV
jgi:hypothetical protein